MNEENLKGKWLELKGEILNTWGKLTEDELAKAKGNIASLAGIIQQKNGTAKEQVSDELRSLFKRYGEKFNDKAEDFNAKVKEDVPPQQPGAYQ